MVFVYSTGPWTRLPIALSILTVSQAHLPMAGSPQARRPIDAVPRPLCHRLLSIFFKSQGSPSTSSSKFCPFCWSQHKGNSQCLLSIQLLLIAFLYILPVLRPIFNRILSFLPCSSETHLKWRLYILPLPIAVVYFAAANCFCLFCRCQWLLTILPLPMPFDYSAAANIFCLFCQCQCLLSILPLSMSFVILPLPMSFVYSASP